MVLEAEIAVEAAKVGIVVGVGWSCVDAVIKSESEKSADGGGDMKVDRQVVTGKVSLECLPVSWC